MNALNIVLNIVLIIAAVGLIAAVLMQSGSSSGLGALTGESQSFTARSKAASKEKKLQRITIVLGIFIAVVAIAMMLVSAFGGKDANNTTAAVITNIIGLM